MFSIEKKKPVLISVDYDSCHIYCPKSDKYLTFSLEGINDRFLSSPRRKEDFERYQVDMFIEGRGEGAADFDTNSMATEILPVRSVAEKHGVSKSEFLKAHKIAFQAFVDSFRERRIR